MGKLYSFQSGEEISSVAGLTPKQVADKLIELQAALVRLGMRDAANLVSDSIDATMRKVDYDQRVLNRMILKRNAEEGMGK